MTFGYDNRNRIQDTTDVFGHTIHYDYLYDNADLNQKQLKFDGATYAKYNYDDADRLTSINDSTDNTTISFGYDNADKLKTRILSNVVTTTYDYDNMNRLKQLKDTNTSTTATLFDRQFSYNNASQINQIVEPTQTRSFLYDNVDRLTSANYSNPTQPNENYSFDDAGNRTLSHKSASYGYQPFNKLTSTATASYAYDANGNLVSKAEGGKRFQFFWDYENRLTMAWDRKNRVRYLYDALGRRVQRFIVGGKENTKFIYDGNDVLVDDNGGVLTKYQNGLGIDNKLKMVTNGTAKYFITDHLGSTVGLADSNGNLTEQTAYDSFGNATNNLSTRYQFTGREFDSFTGLHYYRARWYDSNLGRFISEDPIGLAGGDVNLYGYVGNKPLNFFDPFGLDEYAMMERLGNQKPSDRGIGEQLDELQLMLGALGMTPIVGEPFDLIDGVISLGRGEYCDAVLSASSMIPVLGTASGITKIGKRLTPKQTTELINRLRSGDTVYVDSVEDARHLLDKMNDLRPGGKQLPFMNDPPGTYRGDLINTQDPFGPRIHIEGVRNDHALNPHYNILFHNRVDATIIIKKD